MTDPRTEYHRRLEARNATLELMERRDLSIANARLCVFCLLVIVGIAAWAFAWLSYAWMLVPLAGFVSLVVLHGWVLRRREQARRAVVFYERGLARLDHTWQSAGCTRTNFVDDGHPYAADLDLFGSGSLFDLICIAATHEGEQTLASWLSAPADPPEIRERQVAVSELGPMLDLREEMALMGGDVKEGVRSMSLTAWGKASPVFGGASSVLVRVLAWLLSLAVLASSVLFALTSLGPLPLVAVVVVEILVHLLLSGRMKQAAKGLDIRVRELGVLASVLARIETSSFEAPRLRVLQERLVSGGSPASRAIGNLAHLASLLDARRNAMFAPLAYLLMWTLHVTCLVEAWRARHGRRIEEWLSSIGEFEALGSLACYAYEHPGDPFPKIVDEEPLFRAVDLGHPLIRDKECVRNDVNLGASEPAWIVSGSNMSGKSTLLRAVGVNAVLAQAGAPVRVSSLEMSPCRVGATIRIQDSLEQGTSRFYNEVRRLKQLRDMAEEQGTLLFLLDEIFHGTNSHDRQVGAAAVLREFLGAGAIGLVVTHDLAIAESAGGFEGRVRNVHFVDRLEDGKLVFDYLLRDGIVGRSNAIELMRAVGLRIPPGIQQTDVDETIHSKPSSLP